MKDKFYLSEPKAASLGKTCNFIGDDDLARVAGEFKGVAHVTFSDDGVTRWVYFHQDADLDDAWLGLYYALEARVQERKLEAEANYRAEVAEMRAAIREAHERNAR